MTDAQLIIGRSGGYPNHLKRGDRIVCRNGHHVCDVVRDTETAPANGWHVCFGNWQQKEPVVGQTRMPIRCEKCDAVAIGYKGSYG